MSTVSFIYTDIVNTPFARFISTFLFMSDAIITFIISTKLDLVAFYFSKSPAFVFTFFDFKTKSKEMSSSSSSSTVVSRILELEMNIINRNSVNGGLWIDITT